MSVYVWWVECGVVLGVCVVGGVWGGVSVCVVGGVWGGVSVCVVGGVWGGVSVCVVGGVWGGVSVCVVGGVWGGVRCMCVRVCVTTLRVNSDKYVCEYYKECVGVGGWGSSILTTHVVFTCGLLVPSQVCHVRFGLRPTTPRDEARFIG